METFWIFHLAASWRGVKQSSSAVNPPLATVPVVPAFSGIPSGRSEKVEVLLPGLDQDTSSRPVIRAAAAQMVFASRSSQAFISPDQVNELEKWSGRGVLEALVNFGVAPEVRASIFVGFAVLIFMFFDRDCTLLLEVYGDQ
jgi:uridine phosphorylase